MERPSLKRYALISIVAALVTIGLKGAAYLLTGSVGLLSDALESLVNLAAAVVALVALSFAERPEDEEHTYGHTKAEYLASGFEGALIMVAALSIGVTAIPRLFDPQPLEAVGLGLAITFAATVINLAVAQVILRAGRRYNSITLEADARHLMTDVWTSAGVIAGVGIAATTGWVRLDPVIALLVALNIVRIGVDLLRRSALGLLDTALPEPTRRLITDILDSYEPQGVHFHALRTREAAARRFISFHILVPGEWTVQRGHDLLEAIEEKVRAAVPGSSVFTHLEPLEDPTSWQDTRLERGPDGRQAE
ncbi:MAG: cation transporter [Gemmatimonadetes bacterium]|nr:cation transporter [Gemmatimonadota bacterium]MBA4160062.1 cation transporter [Gemmatimonadota bacterium]